MFSPLFGMSTIGRFHCIYTQTAKRIDLNGALRSWKPGQVVRRERSLLLTLAVRISKYYSFGRAKNSSRKSSTGWVIISSPKIFSHTPKFYLIDVQNIFYLYFNLFFSNIKLIAFFFFKWFWDSYCQILVLFTLPS